MSIAKNGLVLILILAIIESGFFYVVITSTIGYHGENREPSNLYFLSNFANPTLTNETFMRAWNSSKNLPEISNISKFADYSVLLYCHAYKEGMIGYTEWFVLASTLQPDKAGLIHQATLRLNYHNFTLIASYEQTLSFNLTPVENGTKTITDYIAQVPIYNSLSLEYAFQSYYPFLTLQYPPIDFGITAILNHETGKIMIVATSVYRNRVYTGGLLYPENIPNLGSISSP